MESPPLRSTQKSMAKSKNQNQENYYRSLCRTVLNSVCDAALLNRKPP
jgi:hypothetical protein